MFRQYKAKLKEKILDTAYFDFFHSAVHEIFSYDDRIFRPEIMDFLLHTSGKSALIKTSISDFTPVIVDFAGGYRYPDGTFSTAICFDATGKQYNFENWMENPDIIVVFNTPQRTPNPFIDVISYKLTEIDKSENCNVIFSRLRPFLIAHDEKTKTKAEQAMKSVLNGELSAIFTESSLTNFLDGNANSLEVVNTTDVKNEQYIQYLSHFYDTVLSRFFFLCGAGMCDNGKQAQISEDELNRNEIASFAYPLSWYKARKQAFEKSGLSFDFSPIWKAKYKTLLNVSHETNENVSHETDEAEEKEVDENDNP